MESVKEVLFESRPEWKQIILLKKTSAAKFFHEKKELDTNKIYVLDDKVVYVLPDDINKEILRKAGAFIVDYCIANSIERACIDLKAVSDKVSVLVGIHIASYYFDMKSKKKEKSITLAIFPADKSLKKLFEKQKIIFSAVNFARELINTPANIMDIDNFVKAVGDALSKKKHVSVGVLDEAKLKKLGMNLIIAVCQGSVNKPKLMIVEYTPLKKKEFDLVLIGKGVIFDSGGLSLKPSKSMETMKQDMSGAATVMSIIMAAADLGLKKNLIAIAPIVENMPSGSAIKPGDIVTAMSGKTVEILNTDAEGRLILADAISYACKNYKFKHLVDFATLTGACVVALGHYAAAVLGTDQKLITSLIKSGQDTGEFLWQLPLWDDYSELIKSPYADIKNIGGEGAGAGTIIGACFLKEFVTVKSWAHIDIAGTAFAENKLKYYNLGATGFGVRLIINYLDKGY